MMDYGYGPNPRETNMGVGIAKPLLGEEEISAVSKVIRSGMIASGPETKKFEEEFAEYVGAEFACAVSNGTTALSVSLSACGIGPGDEVITSPFTFVATANSILSCGATPVFADIEDDSFNLSPDSVRNLISDKTRAIIPVHLYGLPAKMPEFEEIAEEIGGYVVGDAAQAHGAKIFDRPVGSWGSMECFSFYPTKNMTTGEGGMITTNDSEANKLVRSILNHGRTNSTLGTYEHERFGLNCRITDIASAIGRVQLSKLPDFNLKRRQNAKMYSNKLSRQEGISIPNVPENYNHAWHQYTIKVENRDNLKDKLADQGIGTGIYYPRPLYHYKHLSNFPSICPMAERISKQVISLPVHPSVTPDWIEKISEIIIDNYR